MHIAKVQKLWGRGAIETFWDCGTGVILGLVTCRGFGCVCRVWIWWVCCCGDGAVGQGWRE